jgi:hypothetical protein
MRCLTAFQDVYRDVAARYDCVFIDGQACFHAAGWHGLLDDRLFHDAMHPSLRGHLALAQAVLAALRSRQALGWPRTTPAPVLDPAEVADRYELGPAAWTKLCLWGVLSYDLTAPARFDVSERRAKQDAFGKAADKITAGAPPKAVGLPNIGVPESVPIWTNDTHHNSKGVEPEAVFRSGS